MSKVIYSQFGINTNELTKEYLIDNKKGNTCTFTPNYDERLIVDMPFVGQEESIDTEYIDNLLEEDSKSFYYKVVDQIKEGDYSKTKNKQGWLRSGKIYFKKLLEIHSEFFDDFNKERILSGKNPIVNNHFIMYFPQYADYKNEILEHHHIGQDGQCAALPESIHKNIGNIHWVEKNINVTENAIQHSRNVQEAFEAGYIQAGYDIWEKLNFNDAYYDQFNNKFEYIQALESNDSLLVKFPEWSEYSINNQKMFDLKQLEYSTRETRSLIDSGEATIEQFLEIKSQPEFSEYISGKNWKLMLNFVRNIHSWMILRLKMFMIRFVITNTD